MQKAVVSSPPQSTLAWRRLTPIHVIFSPKFACSTAVVQMACKVAVVSTYPPKNCGLATFTAALLEQLRAHTGLPHGCDIGVIALSGPSDELLYTDPIVHYDLRLDSVSAPVALIHTTV